MIKMTRDEIDDREIKLLPFLEALNKNLPKEWGKEAQYTCPLCGGIVKCSRNNYNGHFFAKCEKCGVGVIE